MKIREVLVPICAVGISCILVGCITTPYQPMNFMGGVEATPLSSNSERIVAEGNGNTRPPRIQQFVLLKAAQDCLAAGYDKFVFVSEGEEATAGENPTSTTTRPPVKTVATNTYANGLMVPISRSKAVVIVRFLKSGETTATDTVDAHQTQRDLEPILVGK